MPRCALVSSQEHPPDLFSTDVTHPSPANELESTTTDSDRAPRPVSPEVAGFIERVVVPALVKRYIAQLGSTGKRDE
jgi:hypothetical protein